MINLILLKLDQFQKIREINVYHMYHGLDQKTKIYLMFGRHTFAHLSTIFPPYFEFLLFSSCKMLSGFQKAWVRGAYFSIKSSSRQEVLQLISRDGGAAPCRRLP